jgi:hypothetical protein
VQRRLASIDDYFRRAPETAAEPIQIRVNTRGEKTGRGTMHILVGFGAKTCLRITPCSPPARGQPPYGPGRALPGQALNARLAFYVRLQAGQEGLAEADKMWRLAGGNEDNYGEHSALVLLLGVRS